jgi:hypothetical protein
VRIVGLMENQIKKYAQEFFNMEKGEIIINPHESIMVSRGINFTRKSLKHFIESRVIQGSSWEDISYLLEKASEVIVYPELSILNPKKDKYPDSLLMGKFYKEKKKAVMVIIDTRKGKREIISLSFKKEKGFFKLLTNYNKEEFS